MTRIKALHVLQCRDYVLEHHGPEGIELVKARMPAAARDRVYSTLLLATDWVDVGHALAHATAYNEVFARSAGDRPAVRMITELTASHYQGLYRSTLASAPTPITVLEKSSRLWSRFYDTGKSVLDVVGPTCVTKRIEECPDLPRGHELLTTPYYVELVRQTGARGIEAEHIACVALGSQHCATRIRWRSGPDSLSPA